MTQTAANMHPNVSSESVLWQPRPDQIAGAQLTRFMRDINPKFQSYQDIWQWSVDHRADFWSRVWDFCGIIGDKGARILDNGDDMEKSIWFADAKLNYAENLMRERGDQTAMVFWGEDKARRQMSYADLWADVAAVQSYFKTCGIVAGDRIAGLVANMPQTVVCMLAAASIGAVWSSCSPDFGVNGVLDRFGQVQPKLLVAVDGYFYKGQPIDCLEKTAEIAASIPSVQNVLVIPYVYSDHGVGSIRVAAHMSNILADHAGAKLEFTRVAFNHPLFIMFSSGTTGIPKCIVHGHGGTLIQHLKEHQLQSDIRPNDRVFYYTTCGWMMWNWLVSALASRATLLLFDGFPFQNKGKIIFDFLAAERATLFGTAAKFIDAVAKLKLDPATTHDLSALRLVTSTGSPLSPEGFDFVYQHIKSDICLSSISGGTDIISCFVLGSPISPVYRGEIQTAGLGLDVAVLNDDGNPVIGEKGELVCRKSFPCQPIYFWNDAAGEKYHNAYFAHFKNIWCHGDYAEKTARGGFIIYGRSDAVLNPGGVRIGTAEIYRQVEKMDEVLESIVIGQEWDNDVRVVLFVKLADGVVLDDELRKKITVQIRNNASPRHVPAKIIAVADIPRTKSGKIVELAVRDVVHGRAVKNKEALANPEALDHFANLADLKN